MEEKYGIVRWAGITVLKDGVTKPRVTLDIEEKVQNGAYKVHRVGFEAPDNACNILTPEGLQNVAVDTNAFLGLTLGMIRLDGPTKFYCYDEAGAKVETDYENAVRAEQKLRLDAKVSLESLKNSVRQAQRKNARGLFEPVPPKTCVIKKGDAEFPATREYCSLVRGGKLEVAPMGSFRASHDNLLMLS